MSAEWLYRSRNLSWTGRNIAGNWSSKNFKEVCKNLHSIRSQFRRIKEWHLSEEVKNSLTYKINAAKTIWTTFLFQYMYSTISIECFLCYKTIAIAEIWPSVTFKLTIINCKTVRMLPSSRNDATTKYGCGLNNNKSINSPTFGLCYTHIWKSQK